MTNKRQITPGEMADLQQALNDFLTEAPSGYAGVTSLLTKDKETKSMIFGDDNSIEAIIIALIQYSADKEEVNVFEKILNMQMKLMRIHPEEYQAYADKLNALNEEGTFN